jgi:hypothetical protein
MTREQLAEIKARVEAAAQWPSGTTATARFNAHARTDVFSLLAEVERLQSDAKSRAERMEVLLTVVGNYDYHLRAIEADADSSRRDITRLKELLRREVEVAA